MTPQNHIDSMFGNVMEGKFFGGSQKNVSSTTVSPQNLQAFDTINCGLINRGDTSTGMTLQLLHLFLLNVLIIQKQSNPHYFSQIYHFTLFLTW